VLLIYKPLHNIGEETITWETRVRVTAKDREFENFCIR
jgi:hypothetical protein